MNVDLFALLSATPCPRCGHCKLSLDRATRRIVCKHKDILTRSAGLATDSTTRIGLSEQVGGRGVQQVEQEQVEEACGWEQAL